MRISAEKEAALRSQYRIPAGYDYGFELKDGSICFDFMDSDITIHPDGSCFETHMALNSTVTGHEFKSTPWPRKCLSIYRDGAVTRECQRHERHDGLCDVVELLDNGS